MEKSEKVGAYSIGVNILLVGIKVCLFFLSGSVALLADAIHSCTDVISSTTVFIGIKISRRKSKNFPYGLYKVENLVSMISSAFIFFAGYGIVQTVFLKPHPVNTKFLAYVLAGVLLTMVITFFFSRYELGQGKKIGSPSLIADAEHIRTDMLSSMVILAGLAGGYFGLNLDKIAALLVALLIIKAGLSILIDSLRVLLDASIDFKTMDEVKTIIMNDPQVASINALWGRNSGPLKFIEADIVIKVKNLEKAHLTSKKIEKEIERHIPKVDHILIHYEPEIKESYTFAVPLKKDKQELSEHFGDAPFFYLASVREKDGVLLSEAYHKNPITPDEKGKGIKISEWLLDKGVDTVFSPSGFAGKGPGYVFADAEVDVIISRGKTFKDILQFIQEKGKGANASQLKLS